MDVGIQEDFILSGPILDKLKVNFRVLKEGAGLKVSVLLVVGLGSGNY